MTLSIGRTRLRAHPLMLLFPIAAAMLGVRQDAAALLIALIAHEGAHLLAARWLRVGIAQLRLMPFGGAIQMDNPYALSRAQLLGVAAAGPAGSLLALVLSAALAHWGMLDPLFSLALIEANLLMLLFNLLPALHLDGGRMLYVALFPHIGRERAVRAGVLAGRAVAATLILLFLGTGIARGRFNLSFALCAVFILASAPQERRALGDARAQALIHALTPVDGPVVAKLIAIGDGCVLRKALSAAVPGATTLFAVFHGGRLHAIVDERRLLDAALKGSMDDPLSRALARASLRRAV